MGCRVIKRLQRGFRGSKMASKRGASVWLEVTIKQEGFDDWVAAFERCCSFLTEAGPMYGLPATAADLSDAEKETVRRVARLCSRVRVALPAWASTLGSAACGTAPCAPPVAHLAHVALPAGPSPHL